MKLRVLSKRKSAKGASFIEYTVMLAILLPVFVLIGLVLQRQALTSATNSAKAVSEVVPCFRWTPRPGVTPDSQDLGEFSAGGAMTDPAECM